MPGQMASISQYPFDEPALVPSQEFAGFGYTNDVHQIKGMSKAHRGETLRRVRAIQQNSNEK